MSQPFYEVTLNIAGGWKTLPVDEAEPYLAAERALALAIEHNADRWTLMGGNHWREDHHHVAAYGDKSGCEWPYRQLVAAQVAA